MITTPILMDRLVVCGRHPNESLRKMRGIVVLAFSHNLCGMLTIRDDDGALHDVEAKWCTLVDTREREPSEVDVDIIERQRRQIVAVRKELDSIAVDAAHNAEKAQQTIDALRKKIAVMQSSSDNVRREMQETIDEKCRALVEADRMLESVRSEHAKAASTWSSVSRDAIAADLHAQISRLNHEINVMRGSASCDIARISSSHEQTRGMHMIEIQDLRAQIERLQFACDSLKKDLAIAHHALHKIGAVCATAAES